VSVPLAGFYAPFFMFSTPVKTFFVRAAIPVDAAIFAVAVLAFAGLAAARRMMADRGLCEDRQ
jgi:hypothetical protein